MNLARVVKKARIQLCLSVGICVRNGVRYDMNHNILVYLAGKNWTKISKQMSNLCAAIKERKESQGWFGTQYNQECAIWQTTEQNLYLSFTF